MKTFKSGVHLSYQKDLTENCPLKEMPAPEKVYISLAQSIGAKANPVVKVGDEVKAGTLIGEAGGFVSSNVFSSVSGHVTGISTRYNALGQKVPHIEIENDGKYEEVTLPKLTDPDKNAIIARIKEAGIVGMGGATFPTHVKLSPKNEIDILVINAAECEAYITCDHRLMLEHTEECIKGILYLKKACGAKRAVVGVESNKHNVFEKLTHPEIEVIELKTKYPQGAEKQLIYATTKRKVPIGKLPSDIGCVVQNIHTAYAVKRAVEDGEPLYKRAMTVSGLGVKNPMNLWVRTGTPLSDVLNFAGGGEGEKEISGGPMMGFALSNLNSTTTKGSSSLLILTKKEISEKPQTACINCAKCAGACPMFLMPMFIVKSTVKDDMAEAKKNGALNCIECGCCAFVCPAHIPIVQSVKLAKKLIKERGI